METREGLGFVRAALRGLAEWVARLAAARDRVADLDDLQHVDDVDGEGQRDQPDADGDQRRPDVPDAVLAGRHETRRERGGGEREAPRPDRQRRALLRE